MSSFVPVDKTFFKGLSKELSKHFKKPSPEILSIIENYCYAQVPKVQNNEKIVSLIVDHSKTSSLFSGYVQFARDIFSEHSGRFIKTDKGAAWIVSKKKCNEVLEKLKVRIDESGEDITISTEPSSRSDSVSEKESGDKSSV